VDKSVRILYIRALSSAQAGEIIAMLNFAPDFFNVNSLPYELPAGAADGHFRDPDKRKSVHGHRRFGKR
jgi:hypothetical protein